MSAKSVFLFIMFVTFLIVASIIFNFWLYLLVGGIVIFSILCFVGYIMERNEERSGERILYSSRMGDDDKKKLDEEHKIRKRVEEEFDRKSAFGDAEELR